MVVVPTPDAPRRDRDVTTVLRDLAWTIHRRVPEVAGLDPLPSTELAILKHVIETPGTTVTALARHLDLRQSNTSAALRTLAARGLVHREPSTVDRRLTLVFPTDLAVAESTMISAAWSGEMREVLDRLDAADVAAIEAAAGALERLDAALHEHTPRRA